MKKKITLAAVVCIGMPTLAQAITNTSYAQALTHLYTVTVLPLLLWILNFIYFLKILSGTKVNRHNFAAVNVLSIMLALLCLGFLSSDYDYLENRHIYDVGSLFMFVIAPLRISVVSIVVRSKS